MMNDTPKKVQCNNGWAYVYVPGKKKDEAEISEISERVTYVNCPVNGADKKICCPSPKTCHAGNLPQNICY